MICSLVGQIPSIVNPSLFVDCSLIRQRREFSAAQVTENGPLLSLIRDCGQSLVGGSVSGGNELVSRNISQSSTLAFMPQTAKELIYSADFHSRLEERNGKRNSWRSVSHRRAEADRSQF